MLRLYPLACACLLSACAFDGSTEVESGEGGEFSGAPDGGADFSDDPGGNLVPDPDAGPGDDIVPPATPTLSNVGVLVRYFINDELFSEDPESLRDSIDPRLDLELRDSEDILSFVSSQGHHGLLVEEIGADARVSARLQNTKLQQGLNGSTTGTIELVVDVENTVDGSRISHIGDNQNAGTFSLRAPNNSSLRFYLNNRSTASWNVDFPGTGRLVLHMVMDTSKTNANERVSLYVDGVKQSMNADFLPGLNESISLFNFPDYYYVLGNREIGGRGIEAVYYYAAMYSGAMSADVVAHNAAVLQASDDSLQISGL